nr:hypothetical protein [uncultured Cohaesibacter sp.]
MQGYQYVHIESFSRKGGQQKKRANGDRAWTVDEVIDEAERKPGSCSHVEEPDTAPLILPGSCKNFDELRQAHNDACKVKQQVPYTNPKTGQKSVRTKALRVDKHTLYSSVISLPILSADAWAMPDLMNECVELFHQVVRFEKDRLEAAGGQFAMAVVHRDEAHMHIHVYGVDPVRGEITWLHPGKAAVDNIRRGAGWKKDNVAEQGRAYCDAMRQRQYDFYTSVFRDAGLMRYGPKRFRLPRAEYLQQMDAHEQLAVTRRDLLEARKTIDEAHSLQESIEVKRQELEREKLEFEENVTSKECKLQIAEEDLFERQDELYFEQRQKQAEGDQIIAKAEEAKREADARLAATKGVADGTIIADLTNAEEPFKVAKDADSDKAKPLLAAIAASPKAAIDATQALRAAFRPLKNKLDAQLAAIEWVSEERGTVDPSREGNEFQSAENTDKKTADTLLTRIRLAPKAALGAVMPLVNILKRTKQAENAALVGSAAVLAAAEGLFDFDADKTNDGFIALNGANPARVKVLEASMNLNKSVASRVGRAINATINRAVQDKAKKAEGRAKEAENRWNKAYEQIAGIVKSAREYMHPSDYEKFRRKAALVVNNADLQARDTHRGEERGR